MLQKLRSLQLRNSELLLIFYFFYLAAIAPFLKDRPYADMRLLWLALEVTAMMGLLAWAEARWHRTAYSVARDWVPLGLALAAYRALDLFSPAHPKVQLELSWIGWDKVVLSDWGIRRFIESVPLLPGYLELCYLLTSSAAAIGVAILYAKHRRRRAEPFMFAYLLGLLLAYMIIPWYPSQPPRVIFAPIQAPAATSILRTLNVNVLNRTGIHSGVFPSAHVSSVFAAAMGMFLALPEKKSVGWAFLVYAFSVAVATVYGRYHYAVDALAGVAVSLPVACLLLGPKTGQSAASMPRNTSPESESMR
jgi:membrane-associated phospholipid phosphatase